MSGAVACFGEVLLRLAATSGATLRDMRSLSVDVGGAEANVAVALANLGVATRMVTTLPDNELGMHARKELRREGVDLSGMAVGEGRMGTYFLTPAAGPRSGGVVYDRTGSAFANAGAPDAVVLDGARHLHISGVSLAVSEASSTASLALAKDAQSRGLTLSFDGNYRSLLWQARGTNGRDEIAELFAMADIVFANHKDVSLLLGREFSGDGGARRREAALALIDAFPNIDTVASTARHVEGGTTHRITARIDSRDAGAESAERVLTNIVDRIGTGDAFAAGVLAVWLDTPGDLQRMVDGGAALQALKHYEPGDFCRATSDEWRAAMEGSRDVSR
ncbi:MAG: sugar kinase [Alteraurantiacibacter sp.]